jgi:hypothetical protein
MKPRARQWLALGGLLAALAVPVATLELGLTPQSGEVARTRIVVLGVDHAAQLVSPQNRPAILAAFLEKLHPAAICIERPADLAQRRDFYEFTYEVQDIVLPFVKGHSTNVCPVDWMPSVEDQNLVFGGDLDEPPEVRPPEGFGSFLVFRDPQTLKADLFFADRPEAAERVRAWARTPATRADEDFPRRLYLYRTFMQAQLIRAAAAAHPGQTVLVVIGFFHKPDLEAILLRDPRIEVIQPPALGHPTADAVDLATTRAQRVAVLSFNLLERQSSTGNVDWEWVERTLRELESDGPSAESRLFRIRLQELARGLLPDDAVERHRALVSETPENAAFTWTGVKDNRRVDSYFDPFGNLTIRQRAAVELARVLLATKASEEASRMLEEVRRALTARKARQFDAYAADYLQSK